MSRDEPSEDEPPDADDDGEAVVLDPVEAVFEAADARIEDLCYSTLKPRIDALETDRLKLRRSIVRGVIALAIPIVLFFNDDLIAAILESLAGGSPFVRGVIDYLPLVLAGVFLLAFAWIALVLVMPGMALFLTYRQRFKQELVAEIFRGLLPGGSYQPDHHITRAVFESSGIWPRIEHLKGDDLLRGRIDEAQFEVSELHARNSVTVQRRSKREPITTRPNLTLFYGPFVHVGLTRQLRGHTIVEPENADGRSSSHRQGFQRVDLGDAAFAEYFRVYATDVAEAAELLGPRVRERLVQLTDHLANPPFVSFVGGHAFLALHVGRPQLEPTISSRASYRTLSALASFVALPELLVREIGPAGSAERAVAGPAILASAPAAEGPAHTAHEFPGARPSISAGDVADLAMPEADEHDLALRPPPESRVRVSPLTGEGLDVSYGLTPSFFVRVLWTLALTLLIVAGVARLLGDTGRPTLDALVAQAPFLAAVADLAAQWPIAFAIVALLFYVLPTYGLLMLPASLRVSREGVRVSRRLWPIAKHYPLAQIASVRVSDRQVTLQRKGASLARRYVFPAPPMQTSEHARWLAAHLRRALLMFGGLRHV
jgi:hypothetical protein